MAVAQQQTSRQGVKAVIVDDNTVLLTRERRADGSVYHSLPGGGVEAGESDVGALSREIDEELACGANFGSQIGVCSYTHQTCPQTTNYRVFRARLTGDPSPVLSEDIVGVTYADPSALPDNTLDPLARFIEQSVSATSPCEPTQSH